MGVVDEKMTVIDKLTSSDEWSQWWYLLQSWFSDYLATADTLIELGLIGLAAGVAWPLSIRFRKKIDNLELM